MKGCGGESCKYSVCAGLDISKLGYVWRSGSGSGCDDALWMLMRDEKDCVEFTE